MRLFSQLRLATFLWLALSLYLWSASSRAQEWPSRPITIVVAFPPGGISDNLSRTIAQHLTDVLGKPVIVENKAGSGGTVASMSVAKAQPDGYTLLATSIGPAVIRPILDGKP